MKKRIAVIDIGSNSIKALVAESDGTIFGILPLYENTLEIRISNGISGNPPVINDSSIQNAIDAIETLYKECQSIGGNTQTTIVATSAVRSASNGLEFMDKVSERIGINPIILSGHMEAEGIASGVRTDPAISANLNNFTVFDLGGGSLELMRFENNQVENLLSLPLGSVQLTEQFIRNPSSPVLRERANAIKSHIKACILETNFPICAPLIGCSGALTTWRALRARETGMDLKESSSTFTEFDIEQFTSEVAYKTLKHRINVVQIPLERADIFPVALFTFKALLELAEATEIRHSLHNLRYGIAWKLIHS
jgi:exopolyphosphatase/guanosine-5'-triphosphate,3'-diphosphate pyrophosphatase